MTLDDCPASITCFLEFKGRHGICHGKIINIVMKREINNFGGIEKSEKGFLQKFYQLSEKYLPKQILNIDQVDVEKKLHSTCTLLVQGE